MLSRRFKLSHGAYTNGSCQVWSDDQCEPIWEDVLKNQEKYGTHLQMVQTTITHGDGGNMGQNYGTTFPLGWRTLTIAADHGMKMI